MNYPKEILDKKTYYRLYEAGVLGNKARTWSDPLECFWDLGYVGLVTIRSTSPGGACWYECQKASILETVVKYEELYGKTWKLAEYVNPDAPILQGYLCVLDGQWHFDYSTRRTNMRQALELETLHCHSRLAIKEAFHRLMDPPSWRNLNDLLLVWPDHVIELTIFDQPVGTQNLNTIFWEVRKY